MADLTDWAAAWLTSIVAQGGAHGPGSRRTIFLEGDSWHYLFDDTAISQNFHMLLQTPPQSAILRPGRYAVTYEQLLNGADGLYIYAVEHRHGSPAERVHLAQPFTKSFTGHTRAAGEVVALPTAAPPATAVTHSAPVSASVHDPAKPQVEQEHPHSKVDVSSFATHPQQPARSHTSPPQVRSVTEALGSTRRYIDAVLMAGFGILCFVVSGAPTTDKPAIVILFGVVSVGYSGYIALSRGGYVMPYLVYVLAIFGAAYLIFK